jgi:hypothetical protein
MDKHLKALAPVYLGTKFVKLDAEVHMLLLLALSYFCFYCIGDANLLRTIAECSLLCDKTCNQNVAMCYTVQVSA